MGPTDLPQHTLSPLRYRNAPWLESSTRGVTYNRRGEAAMREFLTVGAAVPWYRRRSMTEGGAINAEIHPHNLDPESERQQPCSECGELIAVGMGRYNVGEKRYHVECYDATRHMI